MDETAIARHFAGLRGTVANATSSAKPAAVDRSSLSDRRIYISFLACVTHDATIQPKLLQVLLGNHHVFTLQVLRSLMHKVGKVVLWRQKSAWNSHSTMRKWLTLLAKALGAAIQERYVILVLDVHASHIHTSIFAHARKCGLRLVYIPAKLTALLQLCDTSLFAQLKSALRKAWLDTKSQAPSGAVSTETWLEAVCCVIDKVLPQSWQSAFLANGLLDRQQGVPCALAEALGFGGRIDLPTAPPSPEAALCIFPARRKLDVWGYVSWQTKSERSKAQASSAVPARRPLPPTFRTLKGTQSRFPA